MEERVYKRKIIVALQFERLNVPSERKKELTARKSIETSQTLAYMAESSSSCVLAGLTPGSDSAGRIILSQ